MPTPAKIPPLTTQAGLLAVATVISYVLFRDDAIPTPLVVIGWIMLGVAWIGLFMAWFTAPPKRR